MTHDERASLAAAIDAFDARSDELVVGAVAIGPTSVMVTIGDGGPGGPSPENRAFVYRFVDATFEEIAHLGWVGCGAVYQAADWPTQLVIVDATNISDLEAGEGPLAVDTARSTGIDMYLTDPGRVVVSGTTRCVEADGSLRLERSFPVRQPQPLVGLPTLLQAAPCGDAQLTLFTDADLDTVALRGCWSGGVELYTYEVDPDLLLPGDVAPDGLCVLVAKGAGAVGTCEQPQDGVVMFPNAVVLYDQPSVTRFSADFACAGTVGVEVVDGWAVALAAETDLVLGWQYESSLMGRSFHSELPVSPEC